MEAFVGEIRAVSFNFAPQGWLKCEGQILSIAQHTPLYAAIGSAFGGDGRTNFALPDLRGRVPVGTGSGLGMQGSLYIGQQVGQETTQLTVDNLPAHKHDATFTGTGGSASEPMKIDVTVNAHDGQGDKDTAHGNYWATSVADEGKGSLITPKGYSSTANTQMNSSAVTATVSGSAGGITGGNVSIGDTGSGTVIDNRQPSLALTYIICIDGIFPPRY